MPEPNRLLHNRRRATASPLVPTAAMSRAELADAVNTWLAQHSDRHGALTEAYIATLEQGRVRWPGADYRAGFRAVLGASTDAELGFSPSNRPPVSTHAGQAPTQVATTVWSWPSTAQRGIAAIRALCDSFRVADRQVGGGLLYGVVAHYLRTEVSPKLLDPASHSTPAMFAAASSMTEIAGWMAHDSGRDDLARSHFHTAYRLAHAAGHDDLTGKVCASMSHLAGELASGADAVRIAEAGLARAGRSDSAKSLISRLHAMRARGLAIRGDSRGCVTAIAEAERALSKADARQPAEWIAVFDEAALASETALCLRRLGDLADARRYADRVIELRTGDRVRSRAFGRLILAGVLADMGRPDEAAAIGVTVCDQLPTLSSARVHAKLRELGDILRRHGSVPEVAEFLARLASSSASGGEEAGGWPV